MSEEGQPPLPGFKPVGNALPTAPFRSLPTRQRIVDASVAIQDDQTRSIIYQHTVLCQTCLPYRNPGDEVRVWDRENGKVSLRVRAGEARHPQCGWIQIGLPYGPKPRLMLGYLNTRAIIQRSPAIEVEDSLTAFVRRLGLDAHGRNLRTIKDQLSRLAASDLRFGVPDSDETVMTYKGQIVREFNLWFARDERQRVLWPTVVTLDREYFETLLQHAVPLDERALGALSHSAMGLDIYAWLAQRLHRVDPRVDAFIAWERLRQQFGFGYANMRKFKQVFRTTLDQVMAVYPAARLSMDGRGMILCNSPPPVLRRLLAVTGRQQGVPK
jgi:Plasmid encoded RepA protein